MSFYDSSKEFISGRKISKNITTPQNCAYIRVTFLKSLAKKMINKGTERGLYEEYSIIAGYPDKNDERIARLEERIVPESNEGAVVSSVDLTSDLILNSFPRANEFGDKITFDCRITSFVGIMLCHGYMAYKARWFEIDNTNIVFKKYESLTAGNANSAQTVETVAHGLTISRMLGVNFNHTADGKATVTIQTLGGSFSYTFNGYGYYSNGQIMVKNMEVNSVSSVLTDCKLTAVNPYLFNPVWIFGASFEGVNTSRWIGQLKAMGYSNFLVNAYPGRNSQGAKQDFDRALAFGCPKFIYWSGSNDMDASTYANYLQQVAAICQEKDIVLIAALKADNRKKDYSDWRSAMLSVGCRYINMEHALVDPLKPHETSSETGFSYIDNWYDGFQGDDGVHPTVLGAKSIAMQALVDFPELIQYSKDEAGGTIPPDDGNDDYNG